jgi:hypothetical protein
MGSEVKGEVFATRIAWAAGYYVRSSHYMARGQILNVYGLNRAAESIEAGGGFHDASFRLIPRDMKWLPEENWSWVDNPFLTSRDGQRALAGLKVVMMLTSNWDTKDGRDEFRGANTAVYESGRDGSTELVYSFDDWGAAMGKWGSVWTRQKWAPARYLEQSSTFIKGVRDGVVEWGFEGTHESDIKEHITVEDVRWIYGYLGRITDQQLREGLVAAGAEQEEIAVLTLAMRQRLNQLKKASQSTDVALHGR